MKAQASLRLAEASQLEQGLLPSCAAGALIQTCVRLGVEPPSVEDDAAALLGSAKRAREEVALAMEVGEKARREFAERAGTLTELLASARAPHGLGPEKSFSDALPAARGGRKSRRADLGRR